MNTTGKLFIITILFLISIVSVTAQTTYMTITPSPTITPITPIMTFSAPFQNITESNFSLWYLGLNALAPYSWPALNSMSLVVFLLLLFPFIAMWWGGGNLRYPCLVGIMFGSLILFSGMTTLPPFVGSLAYGVILASLAGFILSFFRSI